MGASISAYWPGVTEERLESQPGFYNDDEAWAILWRNEEEQYVYGALMRVKDQAILETHWQQYLDVA